MKTILGYAAMVVCIAAVMVTVQRLRTTTTTVGMPVPNLAGVDYAAAEGTLVLALQIGCRYCEESMPFYKRLASALGTPGTRVIVLMPDEHEPAIEYMRDRGLQLDIRTNSEMFSQWPISGTPTLFLVNRQGVVSREWRGALQPDAEREVFEILGRMRTNQQSANGERSRRES